MTIETKNEFAQYLEFCNLQVASEAFLTPAVNSVQLNLGDFSYAA